MSAHPSISTVAVELGSGLEGLTSCCAAAVSAGPGEMFCKACYMSVDVFVVDDVELRRALRGWIDGDVDADQVAVAQRAAVGWPLETTGVR